MSYEIPMFGPRLPAQTMDRLWTMLAHGQGTLLNASRLAASLGVSSQTVTRYIDLLVDLLLVRRLAPFHADLGKRLVKSPKVYVRDSGLLKALLDISDYNELAGHPVAGASWEGFVIENILAGVPVRTQANFFRTAAGAEIDLLLRLPGNELWAVEIKNSLSPRPEKRFRLAHADVNPSRAFMVYPGEERCPITENVEAVSLREICMILADMSEKL